jgi:hypothetical protein
LPPFVDFFDLDESSFPFDALTFLPLPLPLLNKSLTFAETPVLLSFFVETVNLIFWSDGVSRFIKGGRGRGARGGAAPGLSFCN